MREDLTPVVAALYGLVQGLTEFLPVSSSAHLVLLPWFFGWEDPGLSFDVALHAGTLFAVVGYFWRDWWGLLRHGLAGIRSGSPIDHPEARMLWLVAVSSIPAAVAGLALRGLAETTFRSPYVIAGALVLVGAALLVADQREGPRRPLLEIGWLEAIAIGVAQAFAIVPGSSRSGVTIAAARMIGLDREDAARFSFLLSAPIIGGATLFEARELATVGTDPVLLAGVVAAGLSGGAAIAALLAYVRARSYTPFVVYRFALAAVILIVAV